MNTKHLNNRDNLKDSELVQAMPKACADETAAVEMFEAQRWGENACCPRCGSVDVYKMVDAKTGLRNKRYLWRCKDCKQQFTVRIGTVCEESRIPMRHWAYAFWAMCASKKGVSALQIKRQTGLSYKSALFMMHRVRFALTPDVATPEKLKGIIECDETYVGGKPRRGWKKNKVSVKTPVFGMVQRGGELRRVVTQVTGPTLGKVMRESIEEAAHIMTDESGVYRSIGPEFASHKTVHHTRGEYARGDVTTNTIESSFALLKRGLIGTFHAVSKEHLHRYVAEFDFRWNHRKVNDGERITAAIKGAEGKRLTYEVPAHKT